MKTKSPWRTDLAKKRGRRKTKVYPIKPGDRVTCKIEQTAYNRTTIFKPGDEGIVAIIAAKVCIKKGPDKDALEDFLVVEFMKYGNKERVGLNFINAVKIP